MNEELSVSIRLKLMELKQDLTAARKMLKSNFSDKTAKEIIALENKMRKLTSPKNGFKSTPFAGWAMSIMFAGMAIQRTFLSIQKSATKAFQEISHSTEGTTTETDRLEGSFKYLGYTIGAALDPLMSYLIPIVELIADWAEENPALVASIVSLGIALGTMAMVGGSLQLAINGFKDFFALFGIKSTAMKFLTAGSLPIVAVLAALAAIIYSVNRAFNESPFFKQTVIKNLLEPLWNSIKKIYNIFSDIFQELGLGNNVLDILLGWWLILGRTIMNVVIPVFTALFDTIGAVFSIFKALIQLVKTGDWSKFKDDFVESFDFQNTVNAVKGAVSDFSSMFKAIGNTGVSFSGQMSQFKKDEYANLGNNQKSYGYQVSSGGTIVIEELSVTGVDAGDFLRQLRALSTQR